MIPLIGLMISVLAASYLAYKSGRNTERASNLVFLAVFIESILDESNIKNDMRERLLISAKEKALAKLRAGLSI